jgi:DNA-binding NtrC family response regulator
MTMSKGKYPNLDRRYPGEGNAQREADQRGEEIRKLAPSRATVLLTSGSPETKASVARALHDSSPRRHPPVVAVNCAGLPAGAVEEVLFGAPSYGPVAPASACCPPLGAVGQAERGTLYVAAIDALPLGVQPRFLRFLDEARAVRVVVSSDADFTALTRLGCFRADLAERLSLVRVDLSDAGTV